MPGQQYAVLIGNATFPKEPGLTPLRCPLNDVAGMKELLSSPDHGPYVVQTLSDQGHDSVRQEVFRVLRNAGPDDVVLLYYSGHGKVDEDGGLYLTTVDTRLEYLPATSLPMADVTKYVNRSRCSRIILILDCCYSGAVRASFQGRGDVPTQVSQILNKAPEGRGTYILTASSDVELAEEREGDDYGLLTKVIIRGIQEGAADRDDDGFVAMTELLEYVQEEIRKEGAQKPQGHSFSVEDGQLAIARTGRAPREQKRRDVLKAIYETGLQSHLPVRLIRSALAVVDLSSDQPAEFHAAQAQYLDRLHRACRSIPDLIEELFLLPDLVAQMERTAGVNQAELARQRDLAEAEAAQGRLRSQELENALGSMRQRFTELQVEKEREAASLRIQANAFEQAHNRALRDLEAERAARVRAEALLARAGGYAASVQPSDLQELESVSRIKAEMEAQRRRDDERRAHARSGRY